MNTSFTHTLPFELGSPRSFGGVTLVPFFPVRAPSLEYIGLDEASARGFTVSEIGAEGVVEMLLVENSLSELVLLYEGEELVGAKQNRIVETDDPRRRAVDVEVAGQVRRARPLGASLAAFRAGTACRLPRASEGAARRSGGGLGRRRRQAGAAPGITRRPTRLSRCTSSTARRWTGTCRHCRASTASRACSSVSLAGSSASTSCRARMCSPVST